jgi:hypothetical protein
VGPNAVLGSHQDWESWAHTTITQNKLGKVPASYSKDWKNALPRFGMQQSNSEAQAAQAKAFTVAAAVDASNNLALYTKFPDYAFNRAVERMATLWRASISALKPTMTVTPDASNPKVLKVSAVIASVEPNDPAINVKAKLSVDGGTVRGEPVHTAPATTRVTTSSLWSTEWTVDSANPSACKFELEAIGQYEKTPDLQYAATSETKTTKAPSSSAAAPKFTYMVNGGFNVIPAIVDSKTGKEISAWKIRFFDFEHMMNYGEVKQGATANQLIVTDEKVLNDFGGPFREAHKITLNFDDGYKNITSFVWEFTGEAKDSTSSYKTITVKATGQNIPRLPGSNPKVGMYSVKGSEVCGTCNIKVELTRIESNGTVEVMKSFECGSQYSEPYIYFQLSSE